MRLDRPDKHNAQTPSMWAALAALGDDLPEGIRVVILSGAGQSFSAGLDRRMFVEGLPGEASLVGLAEKPASEVEDIIAGYQRAFTWWRERRHEGPSTWHGQGPGTNFHSSGFEDTLPPHEAVEPALPNRR